MPRIDDVDAGAFHQSKLAEPTRLILAASKRHHGCRCTSDAIAQTTRKRRFERADSERGYDRKGNGRHKSV